MRTTSSRWLVVSHGGELRRPSGEVSRRGQVLTSGAIVERLVRIYRARVEHVTIAVENSVYQVPAPELSRAILKEHLGS